MNQVHKVQFTEVEAGYSDVEGRREAEQNQVSSDQIKKLVDVENNKSHEMNDSELPAIEVDRLSAIREAVIWREIRERSNKPTVFEKIDQTPVLRDSAEVAASSNAFPDLKTTNASHAKPEGSPFKKEAPNKPATLGNLFNVEQKFLRSLHLENTAAPTPVYSEVSNLGYSAEESDEEGKYDASIGLSPRYWFAL